MVNEEKAPLADIPISEDDELELEDIIELHKKVEDNEEIELLKDEEAELNLEELDLENIEDIELEEESKVDDIVTNNNNIEQIQNSDYNDKELIFIKDKYLNYDWICNTSWSNYNLKDIKVIKEINKKISELFTIEIEDYLDKLLKIFEAEERVHELYKQLELLAQKRANINDILAISQQISTQRQAIEIEKLPKEDIRLIIENIQNAKKILDKYEEIFKKIE